VTEFSQEDVAKLVALQRRTLKRMAAMEQRMHDLEEDLEDAQERISVLRDADRYVTRAEVNALVGSKMGNMIQKAQRRAKG
jgi:uncharacterized protein YeeX (DUF496 family)